MNNSTIKQFNNNGFLLVFEGIDGSGKTTQIELLKKFLASQGLAWEAISFPQYGKNEYANQIYDYLSGKFGKLEDIDPYTIAKLYASDRKTVKEQILSWLEEGKLLIANRYISSSKAHLGANLEEDKRKEFIEWLDHLEYEENQMSREDLTILLNVDPKIGQKNSQEKNHPDIHEDNITHLETARKIFLELVKDNNWVVINCMNNGEMKSPEDIHNEVIKLISSKLHI